MGRRKGSSAQNTSGSMAAMTGIKKGEQQVAGPGVLGSEATSLASPTTPAPSPGRRKMKRYDSEELLDALKELKGKSAAQDTLIENILEIREEAIPAMGIK